MRDYRVAMVTTPPVVPKKTIENQVKTVEKKDEVVTNTSENVIFLTLTDSIDTKETFGS